LASLTNNLPIGTSLLQLNLVQKEPKLTKPVAQPNKYQASQARKAASTQPESREKLLETHIDIEGIAQNDLQVASYIERLNNSDILDNVALVESKEYNINRGVRRNTDTFGAQGARFRQFKLTAMLKKGINLTKEDISRVRGRYEKSVYNF